MTISFSITGKELVQSVINGAIDALDPFLDDSIASTARADDSTAPLLVCACGQVSNSAHTSKMYRHYI